VVKEALTEVLLSVTNGLLHDIVTHAYDHAKRKAAKHRKSAAKPSPDAALPAPIVPSSQTSTGAVGSQEGGARSGALALISYGSDDEQSDGDRDGS